MNWRFWEKSAAKPVRKVLLFCSDGEAKITIAQSTQSGWITRYMDLDNRWLLLCKDGAVYPKSYVTKWSPHSGWNGTETFPLLEDQTKRGI